MTTECRTVGELIGKQYPDFKIIGGSAPMDLDITHGVDVVTHDNRKWGYGISVNIYPYVKWSDGCYKPCYYGGFDYYLMLHKEEDER